MRICIAGIPGTANVTRRFEPVGDTAVGGEPAVIIRRVDSIAARAGGLLDQHAISLSASGTSRARIYLSIGSGKVLRITKTLLIRVDAATAGRSRAFVENSTSVIRLIR